MKVASLIHQAKSTSLRDTFLEASPIRGHWNRVQDCGKPWYVENYLAFFFALRTGHPHLRLIANCDMGDAAPTDIYDWHIYTGMVLKSSVLTGAF